MPAQDGAPHPWDVTINGVGYMLARGPQGEPAYREEVRGTTDIGERVKAWSGFPGGMGARRESDAAAADETAYWMGYQPGTGLEPVGGGLDVRFGPVIKGPLIQGPVPLLDPALVPSRVVRRLLKWNGLYWAAAGHHLLGSAEPDFAGPLSVDLAFDNAVVDIVPFAGQGGASELNIALDGAARRVYDGTTLSVDGGGTARTGTVLSFATVEGATITEYQAAVTDANAATGAALGGLTTANGHLLVGAQAPFTGVVVDVGTANTTACTVSVEGWDGTSWQPMILQADTTESPAGTSLGQDGHITWERPFAFDWVPSALVAGQAAHYYARLHWSADLHSGTTVAEASSEFRHEADGFTVVGDHLIMSTGKCRWWWTDQGGANPSWNQGVAYSTPDADVVCLFTARQAGYVHKLDGLYTVDADGLPAQVARYEPPLVDRDETPHCVWLDSAYLEMGARGGLVKFDPQPGGVATLDPVGPERLGMGEAQAELVRVTAVVGDRNHFLFAAVELPDGASVLAPWGTYRQLRNPRSGVLEWSRYDAWSVIAHLRQRCVTAMQTWTHTDGSQWLVLGDELGNVLATRLPRGVTPLEEPYYHYATADGVLWAPLFAGEDPSRPVVVYGAAVIGRDITAVRPVRVQVVDGVADPNVIVGDVSFAAGDGVRTAFGTGEECVARQVGMRLTLQSSDVTRTPIVDRVELYSQPLIRAHQRVITCTVLADDDVRDLDGAQVEWGHRDWLQALDAATAAQRASDGHSAPVALMRTDGTWAQVLVQGRQDAQGRRREGRAPARAVTLTLVTAEGA